MSILNISLFRRRSTKTFIIKKHKHQHVYIVVGFKQSVSTGRLGRVERSPVNAPPPTPGPAGPLGEEGEEREEQPFREQRLRF